MSEENKIKDAEIEEVAERGAANKMQMQGKNFSGTEVSEHRRGFYVEMILFLILGILLGFAIKTEAAKKITVGFNDYKIKTEAKHYNINDLSERLKAENAKEYNIGQ